MPKSLQKGCGLLFPFGDSDRLAELVVRILNDSEVPGKD